MREKKMKQLAMRFSQVFETVRSGGFLPLFQKIACWNRDIILVEKNLFKSNLKSTLNTNADLEFFKITKKSAHELRKLTYPLKSRQLKLRNNLIKGFQAFAVTKNSEVLGDLWYVGRNNLEEKCSHPDLKWLNLKLAPKEAYLFDMYIDPQKRGGGLVNYLFSRSLEALKTQGFAKVYGFYEADNFPALWMHRTMGYKEIERRKLKKLFSFGISDVIH
jgi:ribosomal protein S18 acetylase RimI-like enzyme